MIFNHPTQAETKWRHPSRTVHDFISTWAWCCSWRSPLSLWRQVEADDPSETSQDNRSHISLGRTLSREMQRRLSADHRKSIFSSSSSIFPLFNYKWSNDPLLVFRQIIIVHDCLLSAVLQDGWGWWSRTLSHLYHRNLRPIDPPQAYITDINLCTVVLIYPEGLYREYWATSVFILEEPTL